MKMLAYQSFHWDVPKGILEDTLYSRCHHGNILLSCPLTIRIQSFLVLAQSKKLRNKLFNQIYISDCQLFHLCCRPVSQRKWIFIWNEISFTHKFYSLKNGVCMSFLSTIPCLGHGGSWLSWTDYVYPQSKSVDKKFKIITNRCIVQAQCHSLCNAFVFKLNPSFSE